MKVSIELSVVVMVCLLGSLTSMAQVKYGIQGLGTFGTVSFTAEQDPDVEGKWKFGYGGGIFSEVSVNESVFFRPALNWLKKASAMGQTYQVEGGASIDEENRLNLNYLELSLPVYYSFTKDKKWFVGGGPSFGYGLSGKVESFQTLLGQQSYTKLKAFEDQDNGGAGLKRFDFGLYASIGYRVLEDASLQLGYMHSLSNIADTEDFNGAKINNRTVLLTFAYSFR